MSIKLKYGIGPNNKVLHINEAERGSSCNCICPECGTKLVAKKGLINQHHFAHLNGKECKNATETVLHKLAKEIIGENSEIYLDENNIFKYDNSIFEKKYDSFIPDAIISNNSEKYFVEIIVTNEIDWEKEQKLKQTGIKALVIDLSLVERDIKKINLEKEVLANCDNRRIIFEEELEIKTQKSTNEENEDLFWIIPILLAFVGGIIYLLCGQKGKSKFYRNRRYSKLKYRRKKRFGT